MIGKLKQGMLVKKRIMDERRKLLQGIHLAKLQWQYSREHLDLQSRKYDMLNILERRYMFLYQVAKKRKLNALE